MLATITMDDNVPFIIRVHYSIVAGGVYAWASYKSGGFWLALSYFKVYQLEKNCSESNSKVIIALSLYC